MKDLDTIYSKLKSYKDIKQLTLKRLFMFLEEIFNLDITGEKRETYSWIKDSISIEAQFSEYNNKLTIYGYLQVTDGHGKVYPRLLISQTISILKIDSNILNSIILENIEEVMEQIINES